MKSPFPGFRGVRRKFTTTANTTKALAGILVCLGSAAYGQVVLDDFSTSDETKYNYVPVSNNPPDGWNVTAGELRPNIAGDASAAWFWNQGEKLSMVGDSVTISLSLPGEASNGLGTGIGLFLGPDTTSALGHQIREYAQGGSWSFVVDGVGLPLGSPPSGPVQLSVQMLDQQENGSFYAANFSGGGLDNPVTIFFADNSPTLFFGPFAYNTASTPAGLDNLTLTPVPEPSAYAAVFGLLALATGVIRSRITRQ